MINQVIDAIHKVKDYRRLQGYVLRLCEENERLRLENAKLRNENRQLRRRLADAELRLVRRAHADALLMGGLYFAGLSISRRACQAVGIGDHRWTRARALLRVARVIDNQRVRVESPEDFERAITVAKQRVEREGLEILRYRMPLCRQ
jgi:hypothetical protein